jgi:hypothetical protein
LREFFFFLVMVFTHPIYSTDQQQTVRQPQSFRGAPEKTLDAVNGTGKVAICA